MLRKCICMLWAVCVMSAMGIGTKAEALNGSVRVEPSWCGKAVVGGTVSLRQVGTKSAEGFQLTDGLANWHVEEEELSEEAWLHWVMQYAGENKRVSPVTQTGAVFTGLEEGVYLIEQTETAADYSAFEPFLISVPEGDSWDVVCEPKIIYTGESPKTGDHPAPIIGAMGIGLSVAVLMVLVDERRK